MSFKTIHECDLQLVAHTAMATAGREFTLLRDSSGTAARKWYDPIEQDCDMLPVRAARASFGQQDKTGENPIGDVKLMNYLADHEHMTPFEYQHATFLIEVPLFIRSQIHRHRTFSYNEISRRYTDENLEFWIPDTVRGQHTTSKQASDGLVADQDFAFHEFREAATLALAFYNSLREIGTSREQARAVLPQSLLTKFYMGGTLRNWAHFIELRRDPHAQYEVQVPANRIADKLREMWPKSCKSLGI